MSNTKQNIKDFALGTGMDLCGFSGVGRFTESPEGRSPCDILPGCKTVIVVAAKLLDGVVQTNFRAFEDGMKNDIKGIYGTYGYATLHNFEIMYSCYAIARHIERTTGEIATPCSTGPMTNGVQISIRHAAVAAGLGELGWAGLMLTPEFGARNRFGVILTTLELEEDPIYNGPTLCNPEKCGICTKVCPVGALPAYGSEGQHTFTMDGVKYKYCKTDTNKCQMATLGLTKELGGADDYITTDSPTRADIIDAQARMPVSIRGLQHVDSWHCGKCQSYCPVGGWAEKFKKTGLSKGANV